MFGKRIFVFFLFWGTFAGNVFSQTCTSCIIDTGCDSVPAQPKLCPAFLPTDTAQQYYETDVTFYMPQNFDEELSCNRKWEASRGSFIFF